MTSAGNATFVACLTPPGRGAVAVVVVAGPEVVNVVDRCFIARSGRAVGDVPLGRIVLGRWGQPDGEELVLCRRDEQQIEIHCHGGTAAVEAVIGRLIAEGCQRLTWQAWISRTAPDRVRAEAQIALADAVTERTAAILLDQLNGALSAAIHGIIAQIGAAEWVAAATAIDELLSRQEAGRHLIRPWRLVVFGAPNVGKSSLINAIAGYERAIVSPLPGTTRDVVTVTTAIDGWPVQLSDTAGLRETQDELESAGIELAKDTLTRAELAIFVHDAATWQDIRVNDAEMMEQSTLAPHARTILVINKIDLIAASERAPLLQRFADSHLRIGRPHPVSALNGEGVAELLSAIAGCLSPISLPAGSAVPFTTAQVDGLTAAKSAVDERDATAASGQLHALLTSEHSQPSSF